jgi:photosystem II stability/assembly factor-like uncharacterized protein
MQHPYLRTVIKGCLSLITIFIFSLSPALSQMRQMYLDGDEDVDIRKVSFYSPKEGYIAFTNWIGYTSDSGRTYTKKVITLNNVNYGSYTNINLTFGFGIEGVKAFDKNSLIVYGHYGLVPAILSSADGGGSYKLVFHSQYDPYQLRTGVKDVVFPQNDNIGYAVDADRILKTTDKGMNWTVQRLQVGSYLDHLEAVDNNNVIAISTDLNNSRVLKTSNGGTYWQDLSVPRAGIVSYAYFLDANIGWLNISGYFYKTTNGGGQWTLQNDIGATPFNCEKMRFVDGNTGYALVAPYKVYKTTNSGVTWERLSRENDFTYLGYSHYDLQCFSATQVWVGGGHGFLEMTTNGGGSPIPGAYFKVDTTGMYLAGNVKLVNYSKTGYQYKWLVNGALIGTTYHVSYTHDIARSADTIQLIVSAGGVVDTSVKYPQFYSGGIPKVSSYFPTSGSTGTFVTIKGSRFSNISGVLFGGTPAASYTIVSDTVVTAIVGAGATGRLTLKQSYGLIAAGDFTYHAPPVAAAPVIGNVSPSAGMIGSTVTIAGSGFSTTASQNDVFFGGIRAQLQSASSGLITCTVPAGASLGIIQVLNKENGLLGESTIPFHIMFADSAQNFAANSFTEALSVNKGLGTAKKLLAKDIDGDGKPDLMIELGIGQGDSLAVYRNTTQGHWISFAPRVCFGYIYYPTFGGFEINDLDGDGRPDVVMPSNTSLVKVYRNLSSPGAVAFDKEYLLNINGDSQAAAIADLDNDGKNDIVVSSFSPGHVCIMRNTSVPGALSFGATQNYSTAGIVSAVAIGDLDGDGLKDVIACPSNGLVCFRNTSTRGNISLDPFIKLNPPGSEYGQGSVSIVDYDMDGKPDVVICNGTYVIVYRNNSTVGNFSFSLPVLMPIVPAGQGGNGIGGVVANFSGSARADVFTSDRGLHRQITYVKNISQPGNPLIDSMVYGPGYTSNAFFSWSLTAADFDGDGKPDVAATTVDDIPVIVYRNTVNVPVLTPMCILNDWGNQLESDLPGRSYQWQQDDGRGFVNVVNSDKLSNSTTSKLQFNHTPESWEGYQYRCIVDGRYSSTFKLQLKEVPSPGVFITASDTTICKGYYVTFTATDSTGYKNYYRWDWQLNGEMMGNYSPSLAIDRLKDKDQMRVILNYVDGCGVTYYDTSRTITVHVIGDTSGVQIQASDLSACVGSPVTFTATPRNPGSTPAYDWRINGVSQDVNDAVFTSSRLRKNDEVLVLMNSSAVCAYPIRTVSNRLQMAIKDTGVLSVSIATTSTTVCKGNTVQFTAMPQYAGPVSNYQWMVNGVAVGTDAKTFSTSALRDKDIVRCVITSPLDCRVQTQASSEMVMTVNEFVAPGVSLSVSDTSVCPLSTFDIVALPVNQGDAPEFVWKRDGVIVGENAPTYRVNGVTRNTSISVLLRSSACTIPDSVASAPVVITPKAAPKVSIFGNTIIVAGSKSHLAATATYTGSDLRYQWQDSSYMHNWEDMIGAEEATLSYALAFSGVKIRCVVKPEVGCITISNTLEMTFGVPTATPVAPEVGNDYRYYPNPVTSSLVLEDENRVDPIGVIKVFNTSGVSVMIRNYVGGQEKMVLDVSGLPAGTYFVEMRRKSGKLRNFQFVKVQ